MGRRRHTSGPTKRLRKYAARKPPPPPSPVQVERVTPDEARELVRDLLSRPSAGPRPG